MLNGQATWQSEVTSVPISLPNESIPELSKDQYKASLEAGYTLFDGGQYRQQQELQRAQNESNEASLSMELEQLDLQINNLFSTILTLEATSRVTALSIAELQERIGRQKEAQRVGESSALKLVNLQAEQLKLEQTVRSIDAQVDGLRLALAKLTGIPIDPEAQLVVQAMPQPPAPPKIERSELKLYSAQGKATQASLALRLTSSMPRASLFAQGGYGRPGLNLLSNDFAPWVYTGLRLSWNIGGLYTNKVDRASTAIQLQEIENKRETFLTQLNTQLLQQQAEIARLEKLVEDDEKIIQMRQQILKAATTQLDQGAISAADYTQELTQELVAKQNYETHLVQLLIARENLKSLSGN